MTASERKAEQLHQKWKNQPKVAAMLSDLTARDQAEYDAWSADER